MIINSEYIYDNIKLNEARNIAQNIKEVYEEQYGFELYIDVKVRCVGEFYDRITNETEIVIINRNKISGELNKIMQKSRGEVKFIKIIEVKIIIECRIYKNKKDMYFKSECMPVLWRKCYGRDINKTLSI